MYHFECKKKVNYYHFKIQVSLTEMSEISFFSINVSACTKTLFLFRCLREIWLPGIIQVSDPLLDTNTIRHYILNSKLNFQYPFNHIVDTVHPFVFSACYQFLDQLKPRRISEVTKYLTFSIKFKCCRLIAILE